MTKISKRNKFKQKETAKSKNNKKFIRFTLYSLISGLTIGIGFLLLMERIFA